MKLRTVVISTALLLAACGGTTTISGSTVKATSPASVHVNQGANAASDVSDITSRPNPPVHRGQTPVMPAIPAQLAQPAVTVPNNSLPTLGDRCSNETGRPGSHLPRPMCAPA